MEQMITFSIQENLIKPTIEHERLMELYLQEDVTVYPNEVTSISTEVTINQSDGMIATIMGSSATFDNRLLVHGDVVFNSTFEVVVKIFNPNQYPVYLKRGTEIVNVLFSHTVAVDITRLSNSYGSKHSEVFKKFLRNLNNDIVVFLCK